MNALQRFLLAAGISTSVCALIFIPDWFENPEELAIGDWQGVNVKLKAEVGLNTVKWYGFNSRSRLFYTWLQTQKEPYRLRLEQGKTSMEADVTFNGRNEAELVPVLEFSSLPDEVQAYIRGKNKALGRPEEEIRYIFHRLKEEPER